MKKFAHPQMGTRYFDEDYGACFKGYDFRAFIWNVRTLHRDGASARLVNAIEKIKAGITAAVSQLKNSKPN